MIKIITVLLDKPGKKEINVAFTKEGEEVEVYGLVLGKEDGDYILNVTSDHKVGKSFGRVVIKGIAENGARVQVTGMVKIDKDAQGVDDFLEMRLLLLDNKSRATAEPQLEILANQVKASHAATVGQIDSEQLFYLKSRGIDEKTAKEMIIEGFLKDVVTQLANNSQTLVIQ